MKRRILALFLTLAMLLGMMPMQIFADETEPATEPTTVETTVAVTEETEAPTTEAATEPSTEETTEAATEPEDTLMLLDLAEDEGDTEVTPAEDAVVYITGANAGVLVKASDGKPMVNRKVTVTDINKDGVLTYHEALIAAHAAYCANGYDTTETTNGTSVTKLWGVEAGYNYYFFNNKVALSMNVGDATSSVKAGDHLYATIMKDTVNSADFFTYFDVEEKTVETGEEFTLTMKGFQGMSMSPETQAISGAKVGTWNDGTFTALEGKTTDENGQVKLSFDTAGTYYVTAEGTVPTTSWQNVKVDGPTMPPVCVVTVEEKEPIEVTFTCGDKSHTEKVERPNISYLVFLRDMETSTMTVSGIKETDVVTLDGEPFTAGGSKEYTFSSKSTAIELVVNGATYKLSVTNRRTFKFSSFQIYLSKADYESGAEPLTITPEFDKDTRTGYSVTFPDYASLYAAGTIEPLPTTSDYVGFSSARSWSLLVPSTDGKVAGNIAINKGALKSKFYYDSDDTAYVFDAKPWATLTGVEVNGIMSQVFDRDTNEYTVYVDADTETLTLTPTAYKDTYTVTVNGTAVTAGEAASVPIQWNDQGTMDVAVVLTGDGVTESTYTFRVSKKPKETRPFIMQQATAEADYTVIDEASYLKDLYVIASADGDLIYQWYYTTDGTTDNGTAVEGATNSTFTPIITEDAIGTRYYYCVVINSGAESDNSSASDPVRVTVDPDPTPVVKFITVGETLNKEDYDYAWDKGYVYKVDAEAEPLELTVTTATEGGKLEYSWGYGNRAYNIRSRTVLSVQDTKCTPLTNARVATTNGQWYNCKVTYTYKGRSYTSWATTGETYTTEDGETYDVCGVYVFVKVDAAATPVIKNQPESATYMVGENMTSLSAYSTRDDGGDMAYQWFVNDVESTEGATALGEPADTASMYRLGTATEVGTKYYFCVVTNTNQGHVATATTQIAKITINDTASLVNGRLEGTGTEEDPFLIAKPEHYQVVAELVAQKCSFKDIYLKQTADITLPEGWEGIGCRIDPNVSHINRGKNMAAFSGILDGGGYTITIPEGGHPLLNYVQGATVKNLNIFGKKIAGYGLVNNLEGVGLSGEAICIDNVTLKSGSSTQKAGFIGTYLTNNGFAGCSAAFYVTIKNSTIEKNVVIGYDADQSMIGSFAGRIHGTIENCVSYATVKGTSYVGGILGTRDNALGTCAVNNCQFYGTVEASDEHAGGIIGGGYHNSTAPNGNVPTITDCTVKATVTGKDKVGGIFGGDSFVAQSWGAWSLTGNTFSGSVNATEGTYVGGIIGYLLSMNKYTGISGNSYADDCGAKHGIGYVKYLDTSAENPTAFDGAEVFDTSKGTDGCPTTAGCNWRADHNRTDDPLGDDADTLCKSFVRQPTLEVMVNNSYMASKNNPQKAILGEDNILRVENRTAKVGYMWLAVEEGSTVKYTLYRGKTGSYSTWLSNANSVSDKSYDGTTYTYYVNTSSYSLPIVAKFEVTGSNNATANYWLIVDSGTAGAYTIGGTFTSDSELFTENGIAFTEAGQTVTLTPVTETIGTGEEATAPTWKYTTSDNHVALVDSKTGVVTSVGGGEATITATCDQVTITCTVTSTAPKHETHTYGDNNKCTACGDRKPSNVSGTFTLVGKDGTYATAADGTQLYKAAITISDLDCDGTITFVDYFNAAHAAFCEAGTDGFVTDDTELGLFITKFWGEETSDVGYYCYNKTVTDMTNKVTGSPNLVAFFYQDTENYYDLYTWFDKDTAKTVTGYDKTFTVHGADSKAPKGGTVTVLDDSGNAVEALATTVAEDGTFVINFTETGTYQVWVGGKADYTTSWGAEATDAPVLPSFQTVEVIEPKSAVLNITIVDDENNFVKTTDGEEVYRYAFTAVDDPEDPDGKVTILEALKQLHAQKCPAGEAGFVGSGFITTVWGVNTRGWLSYYFDDVWMQGYGATMTGTYGRQFVDKLLGTEINPNGEDDYCLYMFQTYGDIYTYFYPREQTAWTGIAQEFTAIGNMSRTDKAPVGASITVTDSEGNVLTDLSTVTDENGKFSITFPAAGTYTIDLGNAEKQAYVHSRCFVTVLDAQTDSLVSLDMPKDTLISGQSTTLKALNADGKTVATATWTLAEGDEAYVSLSAKKGIATVKALEVSERHDITLTATAPGGGEKVVTLTILPKAQSISLVSGKQDVTGKTITVDIGDEKYVAPTLTATVLPADATQTVTWATSNKNVATVVDGKVTLTGATGTAKITATTTGDTKLSASVTINVVKLAQSIALTGADTIVGGKTATYAADDDGTAIKAANIAWSLDDTTYASVNASGKVTTKAVPATTTVILTATIKGSERYATKEITINPAATYVDILQEGEAVTGKTLKANVNNEETTLTFTAAVYPDGAAESVKWTTSNKNIATVEDGTVTYAGKTGTVTITATATDGTNKKATVKITFSALTTKVEIEDHETAIKSTEKLTLKATTDLEKVGVTWSLKDAADKNYVTLSTNGTVKAKTVYDEHTVTLVATAKDGGAKAETTLTIQPKEGILVLTAGGKNVTKTTQSVNLSAKTYTLTASANVTWKTSNKKIVSLSATEGETVKLNLLKGGTATITATAENGDKTTVTIKVTTLVSSLAITGSDTLASGKSITLKATANSDAANKSVTWSLTDGSAYATINASGKLTANKNLMAAKTVTVQATAKDGSGVTAEKTVTIQPIATGLRMNTKAQTVDMQEVTTLKLSATVYPATANQAINWTSSNAKIATVDSEGNVTFHKGGTVTITATAADGSGKKDSVKLTVVKSVESIELDDNFLASGKSLNLAKLVQVGPADASNKKVTWSITGDTAYATLSSAGVLKAKTVTQMKTVKVTATAADGYGASATATIEIYPATTKVVIQADGETVTGTLTLPEGDSLQLSAISLPLDAYQDWTWSSNNAKAAEVDETGCVTGLQAGKTVTITAKAIDGTNKQATLKIKIVND